MDLLSIGEVAQKVGMQPSTLRYYESVELLPPPQRISGQRRYRPEIIRRLEMIAVAKEIGFSLGEIKVLLDGLSAASPPPARWQAVAKTRLPDLDRLIRRAQGMKRILQMGLDCQCITMEECFAELDT